MREQRVHERIYFTSETEVVGTFHPVNAPENAFFARILNMSLGGLFASIRLDRDLKLKTNDLLVLNEIHSNSIINQTTNILLEVRWTHDQGMFDYLGCGCQFIEITDDGLQQIRKLLEWGGLMAGI
ncbi:MAG: PilZ domain-containing protein [Proteobacteria bacterium]|nr:PilZ domain-containing protein [Pseudomonadota bacterium]MBU1737151.1 PilZ domain-containing protein [Pseudomonadota bacterium]